MKPIRRRITCAALALVTSATVTAVVAAPGVAFAAPTYDSRLTRAPYLTDLTTTSVRITWATSFQNRGVVRYGAPGNCAANTITSATFGSPITVGGLTQYQNSMAVTGLTPGATYCYRVFSNSPSVDLLAASASPQFSTLNPPGSTAPVTFAVFGDWGDTTNSGVNNGTVNANQAALLAQVGESGARFALNTGDIAYPSGSQTNYGDLQQTGVNVSAVFGPSYWATPGQSVPLYAVTANHGRNANFLKVWPETSVTASSGGVYDMVSYPSIKGTNPGSYPASYYAFSTGGVRFYLLNAAWSDSNVGSATGGPCGSHCATYEIDHAAHWTATSAQYRWLAADLAAHPGGLKMASFHYPLRSDDSGQPSDVYLQNTPGSTGSLEQLLHDNGVNLVFNGHAHVYQRNVAPPGGVVSYVTGGGGAKLTSVSGCASTDAYAIGWSNSKRTGNACGGAPIPSSDAQVHHFLKVTVNGTSVTVAPTDSLGRTFDVQTYDFSADATLPSAPTNLKATQPSATRATLAWSPATDNIGVSAYDVYRNGTYLATTTPDVTTYKDAAVVTGTGYTYDVVARDLAGNTARSSVSINGGGPVPSSPPTAPTNLTAAAAGPTGASLSWTAATDDRGVTGYTILRGGNPIGTVPDDTTSYADVGLTPGTAYTYQVRASDADGNSSPPSNAVTVTTQTDSSPPTTPGTPTATSVSSTQVSLSWAASTDDVGVVRYDVLRDGAVVGTASGTTFADTTVAPATAYTYTVRAYDAGGNQSTSGTLTVTTSAGGSVFFDGFETGNLSQWSPVSGLTVQNSVAHTGEWAVRQTSSGTATYAYKSLPNNYSELWAQVWVNQVSRSSSVNLIGYRTSGGGSIINLYIDANGRVSLRNNVGGVTTYSTTILPVGGWHRLVLHAVVNATSSSVDVTLDGVTVPGLTLTGQNFGTNLIARLQLGETSTGRTYDVVLDDVTVSAVAM